jgi:hypothetical protein
MKIIDNREAYVAREKALRYKQSIPIFISLTLEHYQRMANGIQFQRDLRTKQEIKRTQRGEK